jgi:hypothetical protein
VVRISRSLGLLIEVEDEDGTGALFGWLGFGLLHLRGEREEEGCGNEWNIHPRCQGGNGGTL